MQTATVALFTSKACSCLLNEILSDAFVEQGAHYIRKSLIYSMKKAFLEKEVVELVYKFDMKSYWECLKR